MLAVAHRAGNDLSTLRASVRLGADVVEADVHLHAGSLRVRHHKSLGALPFVWDRWEVVPASRHSLALGDLLAALPAGTPAMLDLKGVGGVGVEVAAALRRVRPPDPVLVCARWWPSTAPFLDVEWARVLLSARGRTELARLRRRVRRGVAPYGVSVHRSLLTPPVVAGLHDHVQLVLTWPVEDEAALAHATAVGVDGVITSSSRVLRRVVAAHPPPSPGGAHRLS